MFDVFIMDMGGHDENVKQILSKLPHAQTMRYMTTHLEMVKRASNRSRTEFFWLISSCCDYANFDFNYIPTPWEQKQIHCWASGNQKFGDTFLVNVKEFKKQENVELLEWYNDINWHSNGVQRLPWPVINTTTENITQEIINANFPSLYLSLNGTTNIEPNLWHKRIAYGISNDNRVSLVPRDVKTYLQKQVYDYPYLEKKQIIDNTLSDVIFISNNEPIAETNWNNLKTLCPRAKRSDGITGREAAYKAAAMLSDTPWFFAVFAKTEVLSSFKFDFSPDYWQEPKHYIFHSRNPLNGLEYGAMNINLYNKQLVLDTNPGIDFTLSSAHAVIPICASISRFNTDPWITWRSAFREVLKLKQEVDAGTDIEIQHRLHVWLTYAEGDNAEYCLQGAKDAINYYNSVNGALDKLQLSFDWKWLEDYYYSLYGFNLSIKG
jgi:hypothetical protein